MLCPQTFPVSSQITRLRGFKDILGAEAEAFTRVEQTARRVFSAYGFSEIRIPILEEKKLFSRALGTETDVVQKEMYEFVDRSKTEVAMRPEGTAGIVRAYLENDLDKTQGLAKLFYMGSMFRSERPQAGRLRQFHQIGVECLGTSSPYADAETIHALVVFLKELGIRDFVVKLNNLGSFEDRAAYSELLHKYYKPLTASLCEDCRNRQAKNVFRLLDCKETSCRKLAEKAPSILDHLSAESRAHFDKACEGLKRTGVSFQIDSRMVRGLDYYTKTVFEFSHPSLGAQDALAAGGRYDRLVESFGGPPTGAVGFALGVERLLMIPFVGVLPTEKRNDAVFLVALGADAFREAFRILSELRSGAGSRALVRAEMDLSEEGARSMKSQMRLADKSNSRYVVILGDNELKASKAAFKDMTNGAQEECALGDLVGTLEKKLRAHA